MENFAKRLKELRLERGLTHIELSKALNGKITNVAIYYWEQGKRVPKLDALILLAKYFNVSIDYLVGFEH